MTFGAIADHAVGGKLLLQWYEGTPVVSRSLGFTPPYHVEPVPIGAYRCDSCGLLELVARADVVAR